jgi:hypothetical protein
MAYIYAPPDDHKINFEPAKGLVARKQAIEHLLPHEQEKYFTGESSFNDGRVFVVMRGPGCMRGIRNSGFWIPFDPYLLHDIDIGVSVGNIEQLWLRNSVAGLQVYWALLDDFLHLKGSNTLDLMSVAKYELARRVHFKDAKPPIRMDVLRNVLGSMASEHFLMHRAEKIAIATHGDTGKTLCFDLAKEMQRGGIQRVIDIALASAHLVGPAGPAPALDVNGESIPVIDGFFGSDGAYPFDVALQKGATDIIVPLSTNIDQAAHLSPRQTSFFNLFLSEQGAVAHAKGAVRSSMYFKQILEMGAIRDKEGREARVMLIPLGKDEPRLENTEIRRPVLEDGLQRGMAAGVAVMREAERQVAADRPPVFAAPKAKPGFQLAAA